MSPEMGALTFEHVEQSVIFAKHPIFANVRSDEAAFVAPCFNRSKSRVR